MGCVWVVCRLGRVGFVVEGWGWGCENGGDGLMDRDGVIEEWMGG